MTGGPVPYPPASPYGQAPVPHSAPPYAPVSAPVTPVSAPVTGWPYPFPPPYVVPPPPPKRSSRGAWLAVAVSVLVATVSGVVAFWPRPSGEPPIWHVVGEQEAPPPQDAAPSVWNAWARRAVDTTMASQGSALLAGDEEGWLSVADPDDAQLRSDLRRRYAVLHQMGVGKWTQEVRGRAEVTGELSWHAQVRVTYCFGDPDCRPNIMIFGTDWRLDEDRLVLTGVENSTERQLGPRPWEATDLAVATGDRTIVATSPRLDGRLAETLEAAEAAAAVADTLARWNGPPSRYVIFLADSGDWSEWYGFEKPEWAGGLYLDETDNEVLVNSGVRGMTEMLTHEFTHVATLAGDRKGRNDISTWWLVEGIAEYAMMLDRPVSEYDGISLVRSFVRREGADPVVSVPTVEASLEDAAARYGIAFLGVRRMADVYGQDAMLDFFGRIVHDGDTLEEAAPAAYGRDWDEIRDDCATYIRSV